MKVSRKSIIIVSVAALSVAAASIVWLIIRRPSVTNFSNKSPEQIAEYLRSEEFRNLDRDTRRASAREAMGQMMTSQAKEYCELPMEERVAYLDKVIETMQSRRREFEGRRRGFEGQREGSESRRGEFEAQREGPEASRREFEGQREGSEAGRRRFEGRREQVQSRFGTGDGRGRGGQPGRGRGQRRSPERMRARTEFTDPKVRAQMAKFREALRERMMEQGIDFRGRRR